MPAMVLPALRDSLSLNILRVYLAPIVSMVDNYERTEECYGQ